MSEPQRRGTEKWPRPEGLRPKNALAALLVVHLVLLNLTPRALPLRFWGSNAVIG
jgi:hypothetical protein